MENEVIQEKSNIDIIRENAKKSENISGGQNPLIPEPKVGKKRGPKPKNEKPENKEENNNSFKMPEIDSKVICLPVCKVISNAAVTFAGHDQAGMTKNEMITMAEAMGLMFDKYAPGILAKYGAEALFLLAIGQYGARVIDIRTKVQKAKEEHEKNEFQEKRTQPAEPVDFI